MHEVIINSVYFLRIAAFEQHRRADNRSSDPAAAHSHAERSSNEACFAVAPLRPLALRPLPLRLALALTLRTLALRFPLSVRALTFRVALLSEKKRLRYR